jgi:hypothetical protein
MTGRSWKGPRVCLCAALLTLCGCLSMSASSSFGPRISPAVVERIQPGRTTLAQVLAELGPPGEFLRPEVVSSLDDENARVSGAIRVGNRAHDVLTWQHDRFDARGRWWLLYLWADTVVDSDILMIVFDEHDRVREVSYRRAAHE